MSTIPLLFNNAVERFADRPALIEPVENGSFYTLTYRELQQRVHGFAGYLQQQNIGPGERLMIWSASRANWLIAYLGVLLVGGVVVPLDVNTKEDFLIRLTDITEAKFLITTAKQYESLQNPALLLINIDDLPQSTYDPQVAPIVKDDDLAELVFTSGTTGQPKGVMLSHNNIASNAHASVEVVKITANDRALSILPLSHMFELTIELAILHIGASIVYARSLSPETIFRLLAEQHATAIVLVPQALQLFMNGIEREVKRQHKEKQWEWLHSIAPRVPFRLRRYLFSFIHKRFGGHFRLFVSGGAYLPPALGRKWENMGFRVIQGYGATECSPVVAANPFDDHNLESAGRALPGVEIRIAEDNEIIVRGPNVALGYWKNPEATAAAFQHGWYHTGDLGYLDKHNNLYIKGRKKNMIVLANGMNVYPEDVENILHTQDSVKEAVVIGLEKKSHDPEVHAVLLLEDPTKAKSIVQQANKHLAAHQQIRGFTIWPEQDFPRTHTLKVKRQDVMAQLPAS